MTSRPAAATGDDPAAGRSPAFELGPVGLGLPQVGSTAGDADHAALAAHADELGFGTLWLSELTTTPVLDPLVLLGHVAASTRRARLGIAVVLSALHAPLRLANQLATIDVLSNGRLVAGLGLGSNPDLYPRYGLDPARRLTRYLDGIELIRRSWTEDEVAFDNGMWRLDGPTNVVRPTQQPHPPILIGARKEQAVRRVAEIGDGWVASGSAPPEEFARALDTLHEALDEHSRDPSTFPVAKRVYVAVSDHPERDRERMSAWFGEHYGNPALGDRVGIVGSAEQIAEHVADLHSRGVNHVMVNPVFDERSQTDTLAELLVDQKP